MEGKYQHVSIPRYYCRKLVKRKAGFRRHRFLAFICGGGGGGAAELILLVYFTDMAGRNGHALPSALEADD